MKELKPCDCGGKGIHLKYEGRNADYYHFIECIKCNYKTKFYQTEEQARDAWNKRELIMLGPKFGEPIQKTPEELGREEGKKLGEKLSKAISEIKGVDEIEKQILTPEELEELRKAICVRVGIPYSILFGKEK